MHLGIYFPNFIDGDVAWQNSVQAIHQLVSFHRESFEVKMRCHIPGVHPGIGSSGSHHLYLFSEKDGEGALQFLLHRIGVGLNLPAVIIGSVVTKEYKISHSLFFSKFGCKVTKKT